MVRTMKKLSCDIETFSDVDLIRCGVYKYADSPNFEMLLFAYAVDDGDVHIIDIAGGEELPEKIIQAIKSDTVVKTAYNAQFERVCLSRYLKLPEGEYLNPQSWYCTAVQAAELALPLSLADVGSVLGLETQKMTAGKGFIALAVVTFGGGSLWKVMAISGLFGLADAVSVVLKRYDYPSFLIQMIPYLVVVVFVAFDPAVKYFRERKLRSL